MMKAVTMMTEMRSDFILALCKILRRGSSGITICWQVLPVQLLDEEGGRSPSAVGRVPLGLSRRLLNGFSALSTLLRRLKMDFSFSSFDNNNIELYCNWIL